MLVDFVKERDFFKRLSPQIRNRLLAIVFLVCCILFLVYFDVQQGFTSWSAINSKLSIFVAVNVTIVLLVLVFYLILKNLLKLLFERQHRMLGINLKTKLIIAFLLISFPATLSHLFSTLFTNSTLESWLSRQREITIQNAQSVSTAYYENLKRLLEAQGSLVENVLLQSPALLQNSEELERLLTQGDLDGFTLYAMSEDVAFQMLRTPKSKEYWKPLSNFQWEQVQIHSRLILSENLGNHLMYRYVRKVEVGGRPYVIEISYVDPKHITGVLEELDEQSINTQVLTESEGLIKNYYIISLLLMLFLIVFVATWFAFYLSRGFVRPIEQLAEATQRVAQGELGYQVVAGKGMALDRDFGQLVASFNAMSQQLLENRTALEKTTAYLQKSYQDLEEQSRFTDLVLENIKTGIVSLDMEGRINTLNRAVKNFLQLKKNHYQDQPFQEVLDKESLVLFEELFQEIQSKKKKSVSKDFTILKNDAPLDISVTVLPLENRNKKTVGLISVYENMTEIQRFQRARAWRDVARRIAHEIKNPLTPIQLSAQRIRRKYLNALPDAKVLDQATQTIVKEVEVLKKMVREFSSFARLPESNLQPNDLNTTIEEAVRLYRTALSEKIKFTTKLDRQLPLFSLDQEQMKRVFINLIDNAVAAIENSGEIKISTHFDPELNLVRAKVIDTGAGVPENIRHNLFEPYITTQKHGTGLGLSIVAQIISDHDGFIRHQNMASGGSCFSIELPLA